MNKSRPTPARSGHCRFQVATMVLVACGMMVLASQSGCTDFSPVPFSSPGSEGNEPPFLAIAEPNEDLAISQGDPFIIRWTDSDPDDNAIISIDLVEIDGLSVFAVAGGIRENDTTADVFRVETASVLLGTYFVRLTIDDLTNTPLVVFAEDPDTANRVQITIAPPGEGIQNLPPQIFVVEPQTNIGASQSDVVTITIRPRQDFVPVPGNPDPGIQYHYDRENAADVTILLDLDENPNNDDYRSDDDPGNIILDRAVIGEGRFDQIDFPITIEVDDIPVRADGNPYFIRATIDDGLQTTHNYAAGRLHVLKLVQGSASATRETVDLGEVGRTLAGNRWLGFNIAANLGTKMISAKDQDADGVGDFIVVAQFGNPRNRGNIGEAYLIYGRQLRFGGDININSVATSIPGTSINRIRGSVFTPHPEFIIGGVIDIGLGDDRRTGFRPLDEPYTLGITDVIAINNLGTHSAFPECAPPVVGVPELIYGLGHNEYLATTMDVDMGDDPVDDESPFYCYPDNLPNNFAEDDISNDPAINIRYTEGGTDFAIEEKMGTVVVFYGENNLLDTDVEAVDDGIACTNNNAPTREIFSLTSCGSEPAAADPPFVDQPAGARLNVAIFDNIGHLNPSLAPFRVDPLNSHYGMNVAVLEDVDLNGFDEIIVSAPRNEIEVEELLAEFGETHPHLASRLSRGNITVWLGQDFGALRNAHDACHHFPLITTRRPNDGSCSATPPVPRVLETEYTVEGFPGASNVTVSSGWFLIRGEKPSDKLGGATSAGDFNLDGPADILCGAPFADPVLDTDNNGFPDTPILDGGTVYIVYSRFPFGNVELISANISDDILPRSPMLRIFGETENDHLGLEQEAAGDVNGDAIDDVFIGSQDYNSNGMVNNGFVGIVFGGQQIDGDRTVSQLATTELNGTRIFGANSGDLFGADISVGGDFNQDGLGDLLVSAPGETINLPGEDKPRHGVVYLVFGGGHLANKTFTTDQIGTSVLPGIVFVGPYQFGTPDAFELDKPVFVNPQCEVNTNGEIVGPDGEINDIECFCNPEIYELGQCQLLLAQDGSTELRRIDDATPSRVGFIGDVNGDGFDDIMIGNPTADLVDPSLPGSARRADAGEAYLIYGNNFGANTVNVGG